MAGFRRVCKLRLRTAKPRPQSPLASAARRAYSRCPHWGIHEGGKMKKSFLTLASLALAALLAAAPALAQKKTLAVVVKGLDNPFFTVLGDGCKKWNQENPNSEYTCLY